MKKKVVNDVCNFCGGRFLYIIPHCGANFLLCADCAKTLYEKLGRLLIPKGLPNMIKRANASFRGQAKNFQNK
jgi:hypothetical protein